MSNGFSAADMSTAAASAHRNGYQAGYADAVKAVEVGKPAAAQEAVAGFGSIHDRGPLDLALADYEREAIKHGCTDKNAMAVDAAARRVWAVLQSAAPFAAAPVDTWFADQLTAMGEVIPLASTPAAPGIDLEQFRALACFGEEFAFAAERQPQSRVVYAQAKRLLARIDASPKGGEVQDDRFPNGLADAIAYADDMENAAADLYQQVIGYETDGSDTGTDMLRTVLRELQDSPKGGNADALLREVSNELSAVGCFACVGSMAPMEDLHGRILAYLEPQATIAEVGE